MRNGREYMHVYQVSVLGCWINEQGKSVGLTEDFCRYFEWGHHAAQTRGWTFQMVQTESLGIGWYTYGERPCSHERSIQKMLTHGSIVWLSIQLKIDTEQLWANLPKNNCIHCGDPNGRDIWILIWIMQLWQARKGQHPMQAYGGCDEVNCYWRTNQNPRQCPIGGQLPTGKPSTQKMLNAGLIFQWISKR